MKIFLSFLKFFEIKKKERNEIPHRISHTNACSVGPGDSVESFFSSRRWKRRIKQWRPAFRLVYGFRAFKEGLRGMLRGKRGAVDHLRSTGSFVWGSNKIAGRPMNITVEPSNFCNLRCPVCETGAGKLGRPSQHMSLEKFKILVDKIGSHTNTMIFYYMGEPFINRDSYAMIQYAKSCDIPFITTCTNGDLVDPKRLVESGIDEVSFQIGGMTQETHEIYRVNSRLSRVMDNLREVVRYRNSVGSKMKVVCGFILMKHNEAEVDSFRQVMTEIGVDQAVVIDPAVRTIEEGLRFLPTEKEHWIYDPQSFEAGVLKPRFLPPNECPWIAYSITINVNGDVVPCCRDPLGRYVMGNIFSQSFQDIWNGEKFQAFRRDLHANQGKIDICRLCSTYPPSPIQ